MSKRVSWHEKDPELFRSEKLLLEKYFPTLRMVEGENLIYVEGDLPLKYKIKEVEIDDLWKILIIIPFDYPNSLPLVKEAGGRIEPTLDRHFFPAGHACLCHASEWRYYFSPKESNLKDFLEKLVIPFFYGQSYFEKTDGEWPFGEYKHGSGGMFQFYSSKLNIDDVKALFNCIKLLERGSVIKGHWDCPCESSRKIRDCHPDLLISLNGMKDFVYPEDAARDLKHLRQEIENIRKRQEQSQQQTRPQIL